MNDDNKKRMEKFVNVLLILGLITLTIAASFGCFNYATLANKAGEPDNIYWFVGIVNLVYNGYLVYKTARKIFPDTKEKK